MMRYGRPVIAEFINYGDRSAAGERHLCPSPASSPRNMPSGKVDAVHLIYTDFVNTLIQTPTVYRLLPLKPCGDEGRCRRRQRHMDVEDIICRPSSSRARAVLEALVPRYIESRNLPGVCWSHVASRAERPDGGHAQRHRKRQRNGVRIDPLL